MLSSAQISAMLAQQNQAYAQQAAYAQAITPAYRPAFSYANTEFGGGWGTHLGGAAVSGLTSVAMPVGAGALGLATGVNAFSAGVAGISAGWGVGAALGGAGAAGVGAGVAGAAIGAGAAVLPFYLAGKAMDLTGRQIYQGAYQNAFLGTALNQGPWGNIASMGSRTGYGFGRGQIMAIGAGMERQTDAYTSVMDIYRSMGRLGQMGFGSLETDSRKLTDYMTKAIKTVKELAKFLNTTMDEALPLFGEAKRMGIYGGADILHHTMTHKALDQLGFSRQQQFQIGMQGAAVAQAWRARRATGSRSAAHAAELVGAAGMAGVLSEDDLMEATGGMTGPDAYYQLGNTLMNESWRRTRGGLGRRMVAAFMHRGEDGTLSIDQNLVNRYTSGEMKLGEVVSRAQSGLRDAGRVGFLAHEKRLAGEMVEAGGPMLGIRMIMARLERVGGAEGKSDDWLRVMLQRKTELNEGEITAVIKMFRESDSMYAKAKEMMRKKLERDTYDSLRKRNNSWEGWKHKIGRFMYEVAGRDLQSFGTQMSNDIGGGWDRLRDVVWRRFQMRTDDDTLAALRKQKGWTINLGGNERDFSPTDFSRLSDWQKMVVREKDYNLSTGSGQALFSREMGRIGRGTAFTEAAVSYGGETALKERIRAAAFSSPQMAELLRVAKGKQYGAWEGGGIPSELLNSNDLQSPTRRLITTGEAERMILQKAGVRTGDLSYNRQLLQGAFGGMESKVGLAELSASQLHDKLVESSVALADSTGSWMTGKKLYAAAGYATMIGGVAVGAGLAGAAYLGNKAGIFDDTDVEAMEWATKGEVDILSRVASGTGKEADLIEQAVNARAAGEYEIADEILRSTGLKGETMELAIRIHNKRKSSGVNEVAVRSLQEISSFKGEMGRRQVIDNVREAGQFLSWKSGRMVAELGSNLSGALADLGENMSRQSGDTLQLRGLEKDAVFAALGNLKGKDQERALAAMTAELGYAGAGLAGEFRASRLDLSELIMKKGDKKGVRRILKKLGMTEAEAQDQGLLDQLQGGIVSTSQARALREGAMQFHAKVGAMGSLNAGSGKNFNDLMTQVFTQMQGLMDQNGLKVQVTNVNEKGLTPIQKPAADNPGAARAASESAGGGAGEGE